ncbi:surface carbohydrate biosynthesis protein [Aestuariivirga sp.]|uniref:surface carbohydrate biosynthesis protein n=1 Tax=Aestuariivirga sp. TaxID=2650926 RepID=UPI0039E21C14
MPPALQGELTGATTAAVMANPTALHPQRPQTLTIPVETLNREFDAKLHLALRAAGRGWRVIFGGRTAIHQNLPRIPQSIYLSKGVRIGNRRILRLLEQLGHVIVALDEESLIRQSDEAHLMMLDAETFNRPRLLFAWGENNAEVWRSFEGYQDAPILPVGNPRMDLLRPELRDFYRPAADIIRQRFGDFILLSSNFSMVNHYIADHVRFRTSETADTVRRDALKQGLIDHKQVVFDAFRLMVPELAQAIAPATLIVRPHPSENAAAWQAAAQGLKNVQVIHEGPMAPWLIAARGLVQNGCTSAVEAAVIGTPALAYHPVVSNLFEVELSDAVSTDCRTVEDVIATARRFLARPTEAAASLDGTQREILRHHIASVDGPLSCERILSALDDHAARLAPSAFGLSNRMKGLYGHYKRHALRAITTRLPGSPSSRRYTAHKFPGIGDALMSETVARLRAAVPALPDVRWRQIHRDIYEIGPASGL